MIRWLRSVDRCAMTLAAALWLAATPLTAQQGAGPSAPAGATATQASPPPAALPGPRLRPEWRQVEPSFADSTVTAPMTATAAASHTITFSTLTLVLVIIIVVLLIT
jgi:hypothetical protein